MTHIIINRSSVSSVAASSSSPSSSSSDALAKQFVANCEKGFFKKIYDDMSRMIDEGRSAGFQDCYRADQLTSDYCPTDEHLPYLEDAEFEPQRLNIYSTVRRTYWLTALWILKFEWNAFGLMGLLRPRTWFMVGRMLRKAAWIGMGSLRQRFFAPTFIDIV